MAMSYGDVYVAQVAMGANQSQFLKAVLEAESYHALGIAEPKIAVITAVEKVNPKMPETVEAAEIKAIGVPGSIIEGPISYDLAMII